MAKKVRTKTSDLNLFERLLRHVKDFFYGISVSISQKRRKKVKKNAVKSRKRIEVIFCISIITFPIIQWLIIDVGLNVSNLAMPFKYYNYEKKAFEFLPINDMFRNFRNVLTDIFSGANGIPIMFRNSIIVYLMGLIILTPCGWFLAYLFAKRLPGTGFMHVIFSLPSAISGLVILLAVRILLERTLPAWMDTIFGISDFPNLLGEKKYMFPTILVYMAWSSLGGANILTVSQMSRVPKDMFEYGRLEGISMWQEFKYLMLPNIWGLISVNSMGFLIGWLSATTPAYELYGEYADISVQTINYYMFVMVTGSSKASPVYYGYTTAYSLLVSLITIPSMLFGRKILTKVDPGAEY